MPWRAFALTTYIGILSYFSADSLAKGQTIKQFEVYSIAESLVHHPLRVFSTTIPCDGGITWTLEPPLFHELGAFGIHLWHSFPAFIPLSVAAALFLAIYRLLAHAGLDPRRRASAALAVALCPALSRFGIQFIPDPLAATFLLLGIDSILRKCRGQALGFFAVAVLTKALMGTAVAAILAFDAFYDDRRRFKDLKTWLELGASFTLVLVPFVAWVVAIKVFGVTSVLEQGGLLEGFLLHGWNILFTRNFYAKYLLWVVIRGAGWTLTLSAAAAFYYRKRPELRTRFVAMLGIWFCGSFFHWFFIRQGNQVHDYYSLSFVIPLAMIGVLAIFSLNNKFRWAPALLLVSVANGIGSLAGMKPVAYPKELGRPYFCGSEMRPPSLMNLPQAPPD
jgi:hypothetical protein